MRDAVTAIFWLLDITGLVPPCRLKPQYGNPLASLEIHLGICGPIKISQLADAIRSRLGVNVQEKSVQGCATVGDVARLIS